MNKLDPTAHNFIEANPTARSARKWGTAVPVATFDNKFGEQRIIHLTKDGLKVKRDHKPVSSELGFFVSKIIGNNIKKKRLEKSLSMEELGLRAGVKNDSKNRVWCLENNIRGSGFKIGTVYAFAIALGCEPSELLPSIKDVLEGAKVVNSPSSIDSLRIQVEQD